MRNHEDIHILKLNRTQYRERVPTLVVIRYCNFNLLNIP